MTSASTQWQQIERTQRWRSYPTRSFQPYCEHNRDVIKAAHAEGKWVGMCGELSPANHWLRPFCLDWDLMSSA